jgi:type IV fimbrial biogenesis protein FimT
MIAAGNPSRRGGTGGFSLLEMMIAIAVLAILTALAAPSMVELGRRMATTEHTNDMVGALTIAKSEAAKTGSIAGVTTSAAWTGGWQVYADSNNDGVLDTTDTLLRSYAALDSSYTVTAKVTGGAADTQVIFNAQGSLAAPATVADINVCRPDHNVAQSSWIHVAASGEITSRHDTSSSPAPGC